MGILSGGSFDAASLFDSTPKGGQIDSVGSKGQCILYVKEPRPFYNTTNRPMRYNLLGYGDVFQEAFDETLRRSPEGHINPKIMSNICLNTPDGTAAVTPNPWGTNIASSVFSGIWTFMLVIDNDEGEFVGNSLGSKYEYKQKEGNRCIYTGYCQDEPVNPTNMGNGNTPNPNCKLVITHKLISRETASFNGRQNSRFTTSDDVDFIPKKAIDHTYSNLMYSNRPDSLMNYTTKGLNDMGETTPEFIMTTDEAINNSVQDVRHEATKYNIPYKNTELLTSKLVSTINSQAYVDEQGDLDDLFPQGPDTSFDTNEDLVAQKFHSSINSSLTTDGGAFGINDSEIYIETLMRKYGNVDIRKFDNKGNSPTYDVTNQMDSSEVNIYSAMISNAIPSIIRHCGLLDLAFDYSSDIGGTTTLAPQEALKFRYKSTVVPCSESEAMAKVRAAIEAIKEYVFNPIVKSVGNIDVSIACFSTEDTYVKLRLADRQSLSSITEDVYTTHTGLGGINSPLFANDSLVSENSGELQVFVDFALKDKHAFM